MDDDHGCAAMMIRAPHLCSRRTWWTPVTGVCAAAVLTVAGCGQQAQQTPTAVTSTGVAAEQAGVVRGRYTWTMVADGQKLRLELEVLADRDGRIRVSQLSGPLPGSEGSAAGSWTVWDGRVLLTYDPASEPAYSRTEDPQAGQKPIYVLVEGSSHFIRACPGARRLGTHTVLQRTAVRYACAASTEEGMVPEKHEMSLDQATGLMLKDAGPTQTLVATAIDVHPTVDADTFATDLPAGAEDAAHPKIDDFRLPRIGGGEVALSDYRPPLVIVAGDAAGIRKMVDRLLPLTQGGVRPQMIGMLIAIPPADWKGTLLNPQDAASFAEQVSQAAGRFRVPVAVDIKGSAAYQITEAAGVEAGHTHPTAVGFVRADRSIGDVTTEAATDDELRNQINTLR
jgi:hypothetical protein